MLNPNIPDQHVPSSGGGSSSTLFTKKSFFTRHSAAKSLPSSPLSFDSSFMPRDASPVHLQYDPITGQKLINGRYMVLKELGRGAGGKVKLAEDQKNGEMVALKIVEKQVRGRLGADMTTQRQKHLFKIQKEIAIMKKCRHPNVVSLKEVLEDTKRVYLVLEYLDGGEIKWRSSDDRPLLSEGEIRPIFRDILVGLEYLHWQGVIHRDIKPANLLRTKSGQVKITDFGVSHLRSRPFTSGSSSQSRISICSSGHTISRPATSELPSICCEQLDSLEAEQPDADLAKTVGSPAFFAPELCFSGDYQEVFDSPSTSSTTAASTAASPTAAAVAATSKRTVSRFSQSSPALFIPSTIPTPPPITQAIDIWALGVTLYCFVFGQCPFNAETEWELFQLIPRQPLSFPENVQASNDVLDLLRKMMEKRVDKRIDIYDIKRHSWTIKDLPSPEKWLEETHPCKFGPMLQVSEAEVKTAISTLGSKIKAGVTKLRKSVKGLSAMFQQQNGLQH